MAIQVKNNLNGLAALKKAGVSTAVYDTVVAAGIDVKLTAKTFHFSLGEAEVICPVTLDQLQKLNAGTLPAGEKLKMSNALTTAIANLSAGKAAAAAKVPSGMSMLPIKETTSADLVKGIAEKLGVKTPAEKLAEHAANYGMGVDKVKALIEEDEAAKLMKGPLNPPIGMVVKGGGEVQPAPSPKSWAPFPKKQLHTATPVKLRDATLLYQPVYGTSSGSRYFMVAANPDLRVAARLDGGTLSVRIEGPGWTKHANEIAEAGFTNVDKAKGYASLHLNVGIDMNTARKTLGAILLGLGVSLETPIPDLKVLYA